VITNGEIKSLYEEIIVASFEPLTQNSLLVSTPQHSAQECKDSYLNISCVLQEHKTIGRKNLCFIKGTMKVHFWRILLIKGQR
jgi:hypothetical protein